MIPMRERHGAWALWLLPVGVLASLGQVCMTRAYSQGATLVVANMQYAGIVFAALYSLLLFGDDIPLIGWAGMALIVASGMVATLLRARAAPNARTAERRRSASCDAAAAWPARRSDEAMPCPMAPKPITPTVREDVCMVLVQ